MQTKYTFLFALLFLLASFILPDNSSAQRKGNADERINTRLPISDNQTRPREKERPQIKNPTRPIKVKDKPIPPNETVHPPAENIPSYGICIVEEIHYSVDIDIIIPEPVIPNYKLDGIAEYKEGDYVNALKDLTIAVEEDSNDYELYYYKGLTELKLHFYEDAENDFSKYIEYFFFEPDGYFQRGLAKFYLNKKENAKEDFEIAADIGHKMAISILKRFY